MRTHDRDYSIRVRRMETPLFSDMPKMALSILLLSLQPLGPNTIIEKLSIRKAFVFGEVYGCLLKST